MDSLGLDDSDEPRDVELSSLSAIYPEIQQVHPDDRYTIVLDIPVTPSKAVVVSFPATQEASADPEQRLPHVNGNGNAAQNGGTVVDQQELAHLPPVHLEIAFGHDYPAEKPPKIAISTTPPWLPAETIKKLEDDGPRLWEEMGRDIVGFTYIDHVQQAAEDVFGLVDKTGALEVDPQHKIAILDYDIQARRAAFERETFDCGVCLDPKKGSACHKMMDCGHVFCIDCLQDCYNKAIQEGDLAAVRCLEPNCAKAREKSAARLPGEKKKKVRTRISPSELLQIPLDQEVVKRYVTLRYKTELESDKNTIYCPRPWCNGAARSKKHKKPQGLELGEASDDSGDENDQDGENGSKKKPYSGAELLAICEECSFAFCSRCLQSWHGEFFRCTPRRDKEELTAEEQASLEYMKLHTTPCPTCAAPAQKTHGCNHMICQRCQSHFCYLCSAWLDPGNPYQHFNEMPNGRVTGCYMRLWELENGDGDDVGLGFAGGVGGGPGGDDRAAVDVPDLPEVGADEPADDVIIWRENPGPDGLPFEPVEAFNGPEEENVAPVVIDREGPLVLRIGGQEENRIITILEEEDGEEGGDSSNSMRSKLVDVGPLSSAEVAPAPPNGAEEDEEEPLAQQQPPGGAQQQRRNNINNNNQNQNQNNREGDGLQGGDAWPVADDDPEAEGVLILNAEQAAWVRQFVQLALDDEEPEDDDQDDDDDAQR
ncbi:RING finger protein [Apodospora peruviana]|uniref:RBR-type E3 ubiquitin transferase n=1 Tax=Apodospora peruviana TaxID=516989 RepID=A0AAE0IHW2_9PEZI|nr:RING finger protein [Apodospora peruviana]